MSNAVRVRERETKQTQRKTTKRTKTHCSGFVFWSFFPFFFLFFPFGWCLMVIDSTAVQHTPYESTRNAAFVERELLPKKKFFFPSSLQLRFYCSYRSIPKCMYACNLSTGNTLIETQHSGTHTNTCACTHTRPIHTYTHTSHTSRTAHTWRYTHTHTLSRAHSLTYTQYTGSRRATKVLCHTHTQSTH